MNGLIRLLKKKFHDPFDFYSKRKNNKKHIYHKKIASIILGVIAIAFIEVQIFAFQKNIETYPYVVDKKYDQFEIRRYEVTLFSSVQLSGNISLISGEKEWTGCSGSETKMQLPR